MPTFLARGAYADVFDIGDGTVAKVFRRTLHTHSPVVDWDDHDFLTRRLFATERAAYERLHSLPNLSTHIPQYFGVIDESTFNSFPSSSGESFVAGCALRLERIPGRDIKIAFVPAPIQQSIEALLEGIRDACRDINVWDCSCFIPGPRSAFVVIDFAYWEGLSDVQVYLDEHKHLPEALRKKLSVGPQAC